MPYRNKFLRLLSSAASLYLIRDEFTDTVAAGAVNGTAATPGPGARKVTDTNSKMSIGSDLLTTVTGGAATGDPGLWYASLTRAAGRLCTASLTYTSAIGFQIGFDSDQTAASLYSINGSGTALRTTSNGGVAQVTVGAIAVSTTYKFAMILRASGFAAFVKGGAFTNWTLVWLDTVSGSTPLYPTISANSTTNAWSSDYFRVPRDLWLPVPLASDGFASSFGTTDGQGHAETSGVGAGGDGKTWTHNTYSVSGGKAINTPSTGSETIVNGTFAADTNWTKGGASPWTISGGVAVASAVSAAADLSQSVAPLTIGVWYRCSYDVSSFSAGTVRSVIGGNSSATKAANGTYVEHNRAGSTAFSIRVGSALTANIDNVSCLPLTLADLFASVSVSAADVFAGVDIVLANGTQAAGMVLCLDSTGSPANFVVAYHDGTNANLVKCVAGTYTSVIASAATYSAGARLTVSKIGTAWRLYYNNALVSSGTISDAGITSNTKHGLFNTYPTTNTLDNFAVYASGSGANEHAQLDNY